MDKLKINVSVSIRVDKCGRIFLQSANTHLAYTSYKINWERHMAMLGINYQLCSEITPSGTQETLRNKGTEAGMIIGHMKKCL